MRRPNREPGDTDDLVARTKANRVKAQRCTGSPATCGNSTDYPADRETPVCGLTGAECDKHKEEEAGA